jgi:indolepyruvate ferredoxin oxidoreductase
VATELLQISLDDKYIQASGRVFMTGIQALVRLPLAQRRRDLAAAHNTAGYITGYRGSPLGQYDQQLGRAKKLLAEHHVVHQPGVNEDLAATACLGTQQVGLDGESRYDGVFAIWYGKGPGVDRSGDAIRHGNLAGSAGLGGVLLLLGDDHTCESSTTAHQSELAMVDAMVPVLNPAGVEEILDYGLIGIAMSRYSGAWVGLKCIHDTVESTATALVDPERPAIRQPDDPLPPGGLNARWPDPPLAQEQRLHVHKLEAAKAFARANGLDRVTFGDQGARLCVVSAGKSYVDVLQALEELGIDEARARALGLRVLKLGMTWPVEPTVAIAACGDVSNVLVVEEKRGLIEGQIKELLYGRGRSPVVDGKRDASGAALFPSHGALSPNAIALAIGRRLLRHNADAELEWRIAAIEAHERAAAALEPVMARLPYFCAGCPHNSSTVVPEGSKARAGIGCHYMAQWMDRRTQRFTQMGGEGGSWIGEAPFSTRPHIFQNIGDGTYYHSGALAVRAAVASGANITFKILFNDAVAMTGGQKMETANLTVPQIARDLEAEGVREIVVVTDEPGKYPRGAGFPSGVQVLHRDELDAVQRRLREVEGTTAIVYDQTCAAEKRRRRKRGEMEDPDRRVVINELVCEGCGDCGVQSNCVAIQPVETELGRKRRIDQSACNKDFSCLKGFCPSFVTVHGATLRKHAAAAADQPFPVPPEPVLPALERPYGIVVTGVGGTGVVTIAAILGMAAHIEGKGFAAIDMIGLAQKGGAVLSHLKISPTPGSIAAPRIAAGGASLLLGCDMVVAASPQALATVSPGVTRAVVSLDETMTGDFTRQPDLAFPAVRLRRAIDHAVGQGGADFVDVGRLATRLVGDAIGANLMLVGWAWQQGFVPLSLAAIERAIELNGVAVELNKRAFLWGRRAAAEPAAVELAAGERRSSMPPPLDELIERRAAFLTAYQDAGYARRYQEAVGRIRAAEARVVPGATELTETVARSLFKLMAYKDEYEVARLYSDGSFLRQLGEEMTGWRRLEVHLAPPLLASRDPATGHLRKRKFGPWMLQAFRLLAPLRRLRGTMLDPFGWTAERRLERRLIGEYETLLSEIAQRLTPERHALAVELTSLPQQMRGFGHVKETNVAVAKAREAELVAAFRSEPSPLLHAAE